MSYILTKTEYVVQQGRHKGWMDIHKEPNKNDAVELIRLLKIDALDVEIKPIYQLVERITTEKVIEG